MNFTVLSVVILCTCCLLSLQVHCCLDILVRSFNEIFSPIIETGDSRVMEPHNVDDLTKYYSEDQNGNMALDLSHPELSPTNNNYPAVVNEPEEDSSEDVQLQASLQAPQLQAPRRRGPSRRRGNNRKWDGTYVPGDRPLVDFMINMMEMFQLTSKSKFITARPRYHGYNHKQESPRAYRYIPYTYDGYR